MTAIQGRESCGGKGAAIVLAQQQDRLRPPRVSITAAIRFAADVPPGPAPSSGAQSDRSGGGGLFSRLSVVLSRAHLRFSLALLSRDCTRSNLFDVCNISREHPYRLALRKNIRVNLLDFWFLAFLVWLALMGEHQVCLYFPGAADLQ